MATCSINYVQLEIINNARKTKNQAEFEQQKIKVIKDEIVFAVKQIFGIPSLAKSVEEDLSTKNSIERLNNYLRDTLTTMVVKHYEELFKNLKMTKTEVKRELNELKARAKKFVDVNEKALNISKEECLAATKYITDKIDMISISAEQRIDVVTSSQKRIFYRGEDGKIKVNDDVFDWSRCNKIFRWAVANKIKIKGHTALWQTAVPQNLREEVQNLPEEQKREVCLAFMEAFIKSYIDNARRFGIRIDYFEVMDDIAREATPQPLQEIGAGPFHMCNSFFKDTVGDDYFMQMLRIARENLPETTKLTYGIYKVFNNNDFKNSMHNLRNLCREERKLGYRLIDAVSLDCCADGTDDNFNYKKIFGKVVDGYGYQNENNMFSKEIIVSNISAKAPNTITEGEQTHKLTAKEKLEWSTNQQINIIDAAYQSGITEIGVGNVCSSFNEVPNSVSAVMADGQISTVGTELYNTNLAINEKLAQNELTLKYPTNPNFNKPSGAPAGR